MTIRKGSDYGEARPLPHGAPIVRGDAELHEIVAEAVLEQRLPVTVGLLGGDLCRTLGGTGRRDRLDGPDARSVPVDLVLAAIDDVTVPVVAHLIAGRLFGAPFAAVMNAQWIGELDLGPRSHPGDGLVDITTGTLPVRQRLLARRRARSGTHLPHPGLQYRRVNADTMTFDHSTRVRIDGARTLRGRSISITVVPDAFTVVV